MLDFLFDLPLVITGPLIVIVLCLFAALGLLFVRRSVLPRLRIHPEDSEFSGAMLPSVMAFYGLAVALTAVDVSQTYTNVSKIVSSEATAIAVLYRDVSGYPEPIRQQLQNGLRDYTQNVIQVAWPLQARGLVPSGGVELMNQFQVVLFAFEPATEGQKLLHGETLHGFNEMLLARRLRLDAVNTGLPGIMWAMIMLGAFIALTTSFFFTVEDWRLQTIQVLLLALFMAMVIFMILALDRPFRGDLGLSPGPYQLVYDQLMRSK